MLGIAILTVLREATRVWCVIVKGIVCHAARARQLGRSGACLAASCTWLAVVVRIRVEAIWAFQVAYVSFEILTDISLISTGSNALVLDERDLGCA